MTPFDVLKTRLQTVRPHPSDSGVSLGAPVRPTSECCQTSLLTQPAVSARRTGKTKAPPSTNPLTCFTSPAPDDITSRASSAGRSATAAARATFSSLTAPGHGPIIAPAEAPRGCAFPSKWAGIWGDAVSFEEALARNVRGGGGGAGVMGAEGMATLVLPLQGMVRSGFWGEVAAVRSEVGVRGLWKGVGTAL